MTRKRIWIPDAIERRPVEHSVTVNMPGFGIAGFVYMDLIDGKTGQVKQHLEFPNLITNALLEAIGSGSDSLSSYHNSSYHGVGTGSAAPTVDDTQLQSQTNPRTNDNGGFSITFGFQSGTVWPSSTSGSYHWLRTTRVFTETQATGTLAEFGVFNASSGPIMGVRTLLKDSTGTPITIVKSNTDQLRTVHELRVYPPSELDVISGTIVIAATSYSFTASALDIQSLGIWGPSFIFPSPGVANNLGSWQNTTTMVAACDTGTLVFPTGTAGDFVGGFGSQTNPSTMSFVSYISASHYREALAEWKPSIANFAGGIKGFVFSLVNNVSNKTHQITISPPITKTDVQRLRMTFRLHFDSKTFS